MIVRVIGPDFGLAPDQQDILRWTLARIPKGAHILVGSLQLAIECKAIVGAERIVREGNPDATISVLLGGERLVNGENGRIHEGDAVSFTLPERHGRYVGEAQEVTPEAVTVACTNGQTIVVEPRKLRVEPVGFLAESVDHRAFAWPLDGVFDFVHKRDYWRGFTVKWASGEMARKNALALL